MGSIRSLVGWSSCTTKTTATILYPKMNSFCSIKKKLNNIHGNGIMRKNIKGKGKGKIGGMWRERERDRAREKVLQIHKVSRIDTWIQRTRNRYLAMNLP